MELEVTKMSGLPMTLKALTYNVGLAIGLTWVALRVRSKSRLWLWMSVAAGTAATFVLVVLAAQVGLDGVDWRWSRADLEFISSSGANTAAMWGALLGVFGVFVLLVRH